ncbi:MAG: hypothetical protein ACRD1T_01925, partial [Acidimicrobiia bacterium]
YKWWLAADDRSVILDTTEDPRGLESGLRSGPLLEGDSPYATPVARAAYLVEKRVFKKMWGRSEWLEIGELARHDPVRFETAVKGVFGERMGSAVARTALDGEAPAEELRARLRWARPLHRVRHPLRAGSYLIKEMIRMGARLVRPSGLIVVLAGPDGTGKSTIAQTLVEVTEPLFRRRLHLHLRPGLLPRPGALLGREPTDPSTPHSGTVHGKAASILVLLYYWLDFFVGGWTRLYWTKARTGLVVLERGWEDMAVDPLRYKLRPHPRLIKALGWFLPRPDIVYVLHASPSVLVARKSEIHRNELERQMSMWKNDRPRAKHSYSMDVERPVTETIVTMRRDIVDSLEAQTMGRTGSGWFTKATPRFASISLPRGPRRVAKSALSIYQPMTTGKQFAWLTARALAAGGAFHLLPRGQAPPTEVRAALAPHLSRGDTVSVIQTHERGRYVGLIVKADGTPRGFAKIALTESGMSSLRREVAALTELAPLLEAPLDHPRILASEPSVLLLEPIEWRLRYPLWRLDPLVAHSMGRFFRTVANGRHLGAGHGDLAPWNLLKTSRGWVLVDWEEASTDSLPFVDVFHHIVQSAALLGKPSVEEVLRGVAGRGWIGDALRSYAQGAGLDNGLARGALVGYLRTSQADLDDSQRDGRAGRTIRQALLNVLGGQ